MTTNIAPWERALRVALGVLLLGLGFSGAVSGTPGLLLKVIGFVPILTAAIGYCPLYAVFGFSTCARK